MDQTEIEEKARIWNFYKPRRRHSWNMLVLAWQELENFQITNLQFGQPSNAEYYWENYILRLWLFRQTILTLIKIDVVKKEAEEIIARFDSAFLIDGENALRATRNMIEHFDDYAQGSGRGPAIRERDLDPWRSVSPDCFDRGKYVIDRSESFNAVQILRNESQMVSDKFIDWYKNNSLWYQSRYNT